jgi:hypothetical protein
MYILNITNKLYGNRNKIKFHPTSTYYPGVFEERILLHAHRSTAAIATG